MKTLELDGAQCGPECASHSNCSHFTWSNKTRSCRLFSGDLGRADALVTPDMSKICGYIARDHIEWQPGNYATSCKFDGESFSQRKSEDDECGPWCAKSPRCHHFNWIQGTCYFMEGNVQKENAVFIKSKEYVCGYIESKI
jgi:hypothetical protein